MTRPLILASASPARLGLLRAAGFAPEVVVSGVDEPPYRKGEDPREYVRGLAEAKATAVARGNLPEGALVVGCDSMLVLDGEVFGKPADADEALERWQRMRGQVGVLMTGHAVIDVTVGTLVADVGSTTVHFGTPSDGELEAYVATGEPLLVAGGFTLDGRSAPFIAGIEGDWANVVGLSLPMFRALLVQLDVAVHELWVATS